MIRRWSRTIAASLAMLVGLMVMQPVGLIPAGAASTVGFYGSSVSDFGRIDANTATYVYAPAFVYYGETYYYFACVGVNGDYIQVKSATTLGGLGNAAFRTVLQGQGNESHTCDPAVVQGGDGRWYLHYSNSPGGATGAGVAVAESIDGPYTRITSNLLGNYTGVASGEYGRGQTTVTQGPDGQWYMAFTNMIEPFERHSIVVLRSSDPSFANTRTEVKRIDPSQVGGWSTQLSFDPQSGRFVFVVPNGSGVSLATFDASFNYMWTERLGSPSGAGVPSEGQALLTDSAGRLSTNTPSAPEHLVVAGATIGPDRANYPTTVTGPNQWRRYAMNPIGAVDAVEVRAGAVRVAGWSFDPNDPSASLQTHVYIGQVGTNLGTTAIDRPDVNSSQGTSGPHGYDSTIGTSLRGSVQVCIAAVNINSGNNTWFSCRTINVVEPTGAPYLWTNLPGMARDIGASTAATWCIGLEPGVADGRVYKWDGSNWAMTSGVANRISVGPDGSAWAVASNGLIWHSNVDGSSWTPLPGSASDIGVGQDGSVFVTGYGDPDRVFKWSGSNWIRTNGVARRIAVGPNGWVWAVQGSGQAYLSKNGGETWAVLPGTLTDIGVGANGAVWSVGNNNTVQHWNGTGWDRIAGSLTAIAVGGDGSPWGVNSNGLIWKGVRGG